jgi:hypothetical protein
MGNLPLNMGGSCKIYLKPIITNPMDVYFMEN